MLKRVLFLLFLVISAATGAVAQKVGSVAIAFYNCENFFDTIHNPAKQDEEFTAAGKYKYTRKIYEQKLHNIATVLQSLNGGKGAAVIGLAEVENAAVLNDLVHQPEIARHNYSYVIFDGPDKRGINVALLYDPKYFRALKPEPLFVDLSSIDRNAGTRDVLHVPGILAGDTVHFFVNHWPSQRTDEDGGAQKRLKAAEVCSKAVHVLMQKNPQTEVIVMGDFNDNPLGNLINRVMGANAVRSSVEPGGLYDPWADFFMKGQGTEMYQHKWNLFDMILISGAFLKNKNRGLIYDRSEIHSPDFLKEHQEGHVGEPRRSFLGTHWINGYSDHFPVILYLSGN